jgi:hypothetical protein
VGVSDAWWVIGRAVDGVGAVQPPQSRNADF